eukprot:TRINITY_DN9739_c1_g1_i3.p1 TRINITY_DN9739_c1_g1~~TRINITY_DN9739_c1_g1_i3.p1  ORF type:complete len:437 (+),score=-55.35 TRINITY_DN9739_c1_g1_i3:707-2017(+)
MLYCSLLSLQTGCGLVANGSGVGMALEFVSQNFFDWSFEQIFSLDHVTDWPDVGGFWECPDFYPVDGMHVLKFSNGPDNWVVGDFDDQQQNFTWITRGIYDQGQFYASKTFYDPLGDRQILWGWVAEEDSQSHWVARGWASTQSLPRVVTVDANLQVRSAPLPELAQLRGESFHFTDVTASSTPYLLPGVSGDSLEIIVQFGVIPTTVTSFGINVRASPTTTERTQIIFTPPVAPMQNTDSPEGDFFVFPIPNQTASDCEQICETSNNCVAWTYIKPNTIRGPEAVCCMKANLGSGTHPNPACTSGIKGAVHVDRTFSSLNDSTSPISGYAPYPWGKSTNVRIFLDRSIMEVYVNEGQAVITTRFYPSSLDSVGIEVYANNGIVNIPQIDVFQMGSIWVNSTLPSMAPREPHMVPSTASGQSSSRPVAKHQKTIRF